MNERPAWYCSPSAEYLYEPHVVTKPETPSWPWREGFWECEYCRQTVVMVNDTWTTLLMLHEEP